MPKPIETPFILLNSPVPGGARYLCQPGPDRSTWVAYDLDTGGNLANPRVVPAGNSPNWRGLPEIK